MRPAERFEQLWRRVSAGTPRAELGPMPAQIAGSYWMLAGILFGVWKTRGFRTTLSFEAPAE